MPPVSKTPIKTEFSGSVTPPSEQKEEVELVCREANDYLTCSVGDLLYAGAPAPRAEGGWSVPILLGNAWQGHLGRVGTLIVSGDGIVRRLSPDERTEVQNRARLLASGSAS